VTFQEKIQNEILEAMKARQTVKLDVLRGMKAAIKNKEIEKNHALSESEVLQVLTTLVKQRKDSIEQFTRGGREDLASREREELELLETYLPASVSESEIQAAIDAEVVSLQAASPKDIGRVMKAVMNHFEGKRVDGRVVNDRVRARLGGASN
jgi:uncharacterized protein YqeY